VFAVISITSVKVDSRNCQGVKVELPDSPPLLLIIAEKGFVMCGFLNVDAAERMGTVAATVSGVKSFDDVLDAQIRAATSKARDLGIEVGMKGTEALKRML
jgi:uncharacterized protein YunC (DUF1805 family)